MKRALREADGRHTSSKPLIQRDASYTGLTLHTAGRAASWYLKYGKNLAKLGHVGHPETDPKDRRPDHLYTVRDAAAMAERVRDIWKGGEKSDDYIAARWRGLSHEDALGKAASVAAKAKGAWTYEELVERYLREVVSKPTVTSKGRIRPVKETSISDVRMYLMYPTTKHMHGKLIRDISKGDLERARNDAAAMGKKHPQRKIVTYLKTALSWASDMHGADSGMDDVAPWWLRVKTFDVSTKREEIITDGGSVPVLTVKDVARILFVAEKYRVLPGRELALPTKEVTLAALWWVALTAQRTHASLSLRTSRIEDQTADRGWYLVEWLPMDVKSGRFHSLPISPEIYRRTIGRALAAPNRRPGSQFVFQSPKARAQGSGPSGPEVDKPIGDTVLNGLFRSLRGQKTLQRKGVAVGASGVDLLEGIPEFSPHKLRDALASCLTDLELPGGAASAVLDHADSEREEDPQSRQAKVTQDHYDRSHRLSLKHRALEAWSEAVLDEYKTLVERERIERFGPLAMKSTLGRQRVMSELSDKDRWLFDLHLPDLDRLGRPEPVPVSGIIDFGLIKGLREVVEENPAFDAPEGSGGLDEVG
jgi:integrase